jgi:hypothetical protein
MIKVDPMTKYLIINVYSDRGSTAVKAASLLAQDGQSLTYGLA